MRENNEKLKVLFVCTGNACRSQMAQGWARHLKGDIIDSYSAGVRPIGVSRRAIKTMAQAGVDISTQTSDHIDEYSDIEFDYVVTLCDNAASQCPVFAGKGKVVHRPFEDPYFATGSEQEVMGEFNRARDDIKAFIETIPKSLESA